MSSIRLSPKHGVNPAIIKCFWCGEDNGIALLGRFSAVENGVLNRDAEAPHYVFGGYEPCEKCKRNFALGVLLMEACTFPQFNGQPEMQEGVFPTGRHVVIKREAADRIFNVPVKDKAFVDRETFNMLFGNMPDEASA